MNYIDCSVRHRLKHLFCGIWLFLQHSIATTVVKASRAGRLVQFKITYTLSHLSQKYIYPTQHLFRVHANLLYSNCMYPPSNLNFMCLGRNMSSLQKQTVTYNQYCNFHSPLSGRRKEQLGIKTAMSKVVPLTWDEVSCVSKHYTTLGWAWANHILMHSMSNFVCTVHLCTICHTVNLAHATYQMFPSQWHAECGLDEEWEMRLTK